MILLEKSLQVSISAMVPRKKKLQQPYPLSLYGPLSKHILHENPTRRTSYNFLPLTATSVGSNGDFENIVDVMLSPVGPSAAPKIDTAKWSGYSSQWILSDYPALVLPVDKVDVDKDGEKVIYKPRDEKDLYNWSLWERYGPEGYKDAPNSVQLIGRRYEDERVIQALEIV
ncbi:hypothetical protein WAI453_004640 [Rhynchosporium graminicola]